MRKSFIIDFCCRVAAQTAIVNAEHISRQQQSEQV